MAKKKGKGKIKIKEIKEISVPNKLQPKDDDYPIFCFKYLNDTSFKDCKDSKILIDFLLRLQKLSDLGWKEIRKSNRHSFGMEKISVNAIKPSLPKCITPDVEYLHVFRATGSNLPFVGIVIQKVFRVLFIETKFGDIYNH